MNNNDFFNKYKYYLIAAGTAVVAGISYGVYQFFKSEDIKLSKWLENYLHFIEEKLNKQPSLTVECIAYMINFIGELEDYFYHARNPDLESERIKELDNPNNHKYEECIIKSMELVDKAFHEAVSFIEEKFGYSMSDIQTQIHESTKNGSSEYRELAAKCRFPYAKEDLPKLTREELKTAYLEFQNGLISQSEKISRELQIGHFQPNIEQEALFNIYNIKYRFKDGFRKKYKLNEKYLDQMVEEDPVLKTDIDIVNIKKKVEDVSRNPR